MVAHGQSIEAKMKKAADLRSGNIKVQKVLGPEKDDLREQYTAAKKYLGRHSKTRMDRLDMEVEHDLRTMSVKELYNVINQVNWLKDQH